MSAGVSHGCVRRFVAAIMATNLALAFLALCLASCLAPGGSDAHACCRGEKSTIAAATDRCCLDTEGVAAAAGDLPACASTGGSAHMLLPSTPAAHFGVPRVAASPPFILRV
jgi:hypothetical protein